MIDGNGFLLIGGEYVENADVTVLPGDLDMTLHPTQMDYACFTAVLALQIPLFMGIRERDC